MGDCFDFLKNNTLSRADLNGENGIARNVHYGDILIKFGDCLDGEQSDLPFISDDTVLPKFAGSILSEGDVIFADTAEDEAAGKCIELRKLPKEPTISGLHTIPARPRFPFGTGYLGHYLNSDAYHRQLLPLMQGIKVISVSKAALQDTQVRFPSLSEQSAIGVALSEIDALITLHQRKRRKRLFTHLLVWEQRKFADFVTASGIRNSENLELPSYSVTNDRGFVPQDEQFENGGTMREADKTSYWIVEPKSFAYNPARINVGSIGYQSTSRNVIVSSLYEVFQADETCDNRFLWHWFKTRLFTQQIEMLQEGGVRLYFFFDKLLKSGISMPSVDEQRLIGEQFDRIDHLITLHQRKHEKLVQLKKSMLDKMFPKPGETEPVIRFAGFTDPWEQRKLGEAATIVGGGTPSTNNDAYWDGDIDWYSPAELGEQVYADRSVRRITQAGYDSCSATLLPAGKTILFTSRAGIGNTAILRRSACTNQGFQSLVVNDDTDVYFVYAMTDRIKKFAEQKASGSTFLEISGKGLAAGEFAFPSKDEQTAIGSMFKQLDHLITLHQREPRFADTG